MPNATDLLHATLIGLAATAFMDGWLSISARLGLPSSGFRLVGRWVGHLGRGRAVHASIAKSAPVPGELALGWLTHYAVGVAYAWALVGWLPAWLDRPSLAPTLAFGLATVAAPLLVLQPAMGAGIAGSKTPSPLLNCLRSSLNHAAFGLGLYFAAAATARFLR